MKQKRLFFPKSTRNALLLLAFVLSPATSMATKYLGGDISLLSKYEEHGANYMTADGQKIDDMLQFFRSKGWNSMRVRLFVDPSKAPDDDKGEGVCQDLEYVTKLGRRIKEAGLKFMLDFHYSDTWTDPAQHTTPSAWNSSDPAVLEQMLYDYTVSTLNTLKAAGAEPDFIQPGNAVGNPIAITAAELLCSKSRVSRAEPVRTVCIDVSLESYVITFQRRNKAKRVFYRYLIISTGCKDKAWACFLIHCLCSVRGRNQIIMN